MSLEKCPNCTRPLDEPEQQSCSQCGYRFMEPVQQDREWVYKEPPPKEPGRPLGVTLLALFYAVLGILPMVDGAALVFIPDRVTRLSNPPLTDRLIGVGELGVGLACLVFAFAALSLRPWARIFGIAVISIAAAWSLVEAMAANSATIVIGRAVLAGLFVAYLAQDSVRRAFEGGRARKIGRGLVVGMALVVLSTAGLYGLFASALDQYAAKPLATAAPGSVTPICFVGSTCDSPLDATLNPDRVVYVYNPPEGTPWPSKPELTVSRIEGNMERLVLQHWIGIFDWSPNGVGGGTRGSFSCDVCQESATYVVRLRDGSVLVAQGFFRT